MRVVALMFALLLALAPPVRAQDPGPSFRAVIQNQLDAFLADDFARAFGYAAPGIRNVFGTAENFGAMVRGGYPMVWRPKSVEYLDLHPRDGGLWQHVRITDGSGKAYMLDYQLVETPDGPRIGAVEVLPAPDVGT